MNHGWDYFLIKNPENSDSSHTWKSIWRVVMCRPAGDSVMNGSVMKHRDSVTPPTPPTPQPRHQTVFLLLRGTGCITPPALGKMSAWCSRTAALAASFLITFASLELTASCLLLSEGAWILKPAARKWNCWNSRCFHQLRRKGRQQDDWLLGDSVSLNYAEKVMTVFIFDWIISLWESQKKTWLSSTCTFQ